MKKITIVIIIVGAIIVAAGSAVGGFFGGRAYQRNQANTVRNNFLRERGVAGFDPNAAPNAVPNAANNPGRGFGGGGASGQVKSIDGNTLTLTTGQNETTVTLSDTTSIVKSTPGTTSDLAAGQQVMVTGQRNPDGNVTATQVLILNTSDSQAPAGTTP